MSSWLFPNLVLGRRRWGGEPAVAHGAAGVSGRDQRRPGEHGGGQLEVALLRHREGLRLAGGPGCHPLHDGAGPGLRGGGNVLAGCPMQEGLWWERSAGRWQRAALTGTLLSSAAELSVECVCSGLAGLC